MNNKELQIIVEHLVENASPYLIIMFGSTVKGNLKKDSDFDIAFLSDVNIGKYELFMTSQELASKINRNVDLIDLNQANTVFQAQIIHTGKVIYCTDEKKKAQFELKTLKMYAKLNEERFHIIRNIEESGSIYEK
ncbi:nucleotidyltransferase domain-containing protein [Evansella sp. AB-P1]|uniref:type VII toxin-antitoxin system MntA family adenylyltransferase antitoxin n=1 Tax=Evansella sp. AB-P1 TaxID=3037653 RepID=UPI00241EA94C|nr:nucleotidyltransferase domain-containing protein [Evansella sp. AB-P1]MDG5788874.1 nucleotidyltransferase domain-containing protein [Evansella sp. AB-P1]